MMLPTTVFHIRITEKGRRKFNLWLPVILIWPVVVALMVALAPIAIVLSLVLGRYRRLILAGPRLIALSWALRGLRIDVKDGKDQVLIIVD